MMSIAKGLDSLIEATVKGLREKQDFASRWCKHYSDDCIEKLKDYAHKNEDCGQTCEFCQTFKWAIDRAKHYEKNLGISWEDVLSSWEEDRNYWYMNYYQGSNQREIKSGTTKVFENIDEFRKSVGSDGFRCPSCGSITNDPYKCGNCDWVVFGLLGDLGKGIFVYIKDKIGGQTIFMPVAWEIANSINDNQELIGGVER